MKNDLLSIYNKLFNHFGPQHWWPAKTPFEVMAGAVLTQNTSWSNVEKAIENLRKNRALSPLSMSRLSDKSLANLIKPAGYYNIKSSRLKSLLSYFLKKYKCDIKKMVLKDVSTLRGELLGVKGVGPETADSILLYALNKPVFVIDAYTRRIFGRHGILKEDASYDEAQGVLMRALDSDVKLFNEFHALLVKLAKVYCLKRRPLCESCPLK